MIIETTGRNNIVVRRRDPDSLERITEKYSSSPYFFVKNEDAYRLVEPSILHRETGYTGVYGEQLTKLVVKSPGDVSRLRKQFPEIPTWEANIPFANRVMADLDILPPNYEHRIWFLDFEWSPSNGNITIMVVYDSYTKKHFVFFTHPDYSAGYYDRVECLEHPDGKEEVVFDPPARAFSDEKSMLKAFGSHLRKHDPDVITGWNVVNADCKQLIQRMKVCGLNPNDLSPLKRINYQFKDWSQPIAGINVIDLMITFTKLWVLKHGQLPSKALDTVATECLNEGKVKLKDGHDTYFTDFGTYLDYSMTDVKLLPRLNSLNNAIEHHLAIQHIVGCSIFTTPFITRICTIMAFRDKKFNLQIPTSPRFMKEDYSGADIKEPTPGLYKSIGILDIRAMYHSNAHLHNISWDTLDENGVDCGNGTRFRKGEKGFLVRTMDTLTDLRNEYKTKMKEAETEQDATTYDSLQYAAKSLIASLYGAAGDSKYGLYHPKVAAAITFTSRETLHRLQDECEKRGHEVLYSHTDSCFVVVKSPEQMETLCSELNDVMDPIFVEGERYCESFFIKAKNRYCANVVWSGGSYHNAKRYFKGLELKQSRMPPIMKSVMETVLGNIMEGVTESETTDWVSSVVKNIVSGEIAIHRLCIKGKLEKNLSTYKVLGEARAGAAWANDVLGKGYRAGSRFMVTIDDEGNYIAFDEPRDIDGFAKVGYSTIASRFVIEKIRPYYEVMNWDMIPIENAHSGLSDVVWV